MSGLPQLLKDMGSTKMLVIGVFAIVLTSALIMDAVRMSNPVLSPLFAGLSPDDSAQIVGQLEGMGIPYDIREGGAQILVPSNEVLRLRMTMAQSGLPTSGSVVGYEIFDKSDTLGASSFVNNVNLLRALEGELARTITSFKHIQTARVHLVVPRRDLFSRKRQKPSASIVLRMRGNKYLDKNETAAIGHLVAAAVPGLSVDKITIVDSSGRPFKLGAQNENDPAMAASTSQEYRLAVERKMKGVIEDIVGRSVGMGKVEAQISAEIDFDRIITNAEIYDPEGQVARSIQTTESKESSAEGNAGNVTVANNLPGNKANEGSSGAQTDANRVEEITNFEISKTIKNHVKETGTIKRLSIAVLVDGDYEYDADSEEYNYKPRSEDELKKLSALVKSSVGFNVERGDTIELVNMRFSTEIQGEIKEGSFEWLKRDLSNIIQTIVIGVVVILVILLIVRPMVSRAFEIAKTEASENDLEAALAGAENVSSADLAAFDAERGDVDEAKEVMDIARFEKKSSSSSVGAINDIVDSHAEETVSIIRQWMEKED